MDSMFGDTYNQDPDRFAKYNRLPDKPQEDNGKPVEENGLD